LIPYKDAEECCTNVPDIGERAIDVIAAVSLHRPAIRPPYAVVALFSATPSEE
jgi:hypothetical protein